MQACCDPKSKSLAMLLLHRVLPLYFSSDGAEQPVSDPQRASAIPCPAGPDADPEADKKQQEQAELMAQLLIEEEEARNSAANAASKSKSKKKGKGKKGSERSAAATALRADEPPPSPAAASVPAANGTAAGQEPNDRKQVRITQATGLWLHLALIECSFAIDRIVHCWV